MILSISVLKQILEKTVVYNGIIDMSQVAATCDKANGCDNGDFCFIYFILLC
jgi:hypothetical protein